MSTEELLSRNEAITSIDDLFSKSLDDLDDLPTFDTPPPGAYILSITMETKEINQKESVVAGFTVKETVELKDPEAKPVVNGTQFNQLFMLNPTGIGKLKEFLAPLGEHFNEKSVGVLVRDTVKDVLVAAIVKNRTDKKDPDRIYGSVVITAVQ